MDRELRDPSPRDVIADNLGRLQKIIDLLFTESRDVTGVFAVARKRSVTTGREACRTDGDVGLIHRTRWHFRTTATLLQRTTHLAVLHPTVVITARRDRLSRFCHRRTVLDHLFMSIGEGILQARPVEGLLMRKAPDHQDYGSFAITAQQIRLVQAAMSEPNIARKDYEASQRVLDSILRMLRRQRAQLENIATGGYSTPEQRAKARDQIEKLAMLEAIAGSDTPKRPN